MWKNKRTSKTWQQQKSTARGLAFDNQPSTRLGNSDSEWVHPRNRVWCEPWKEQHLGKTKSGGERGGEESGARARDLGSLGEVRGEGLGPRRPPAQRCPGDAGCSQMRKNLNAEPRGSDHLPWVMSSHWVFFISTAMWYTWRAGPGRCVGREARAPCCYYFGISSNKYII